MVTTTPRLPPAPATAAVCYPESDGQPVAETDVHRTLMFELIGMLQAFFRADPHVYISGNLFLYYQEGDPRQVVAPDVFVVQGVRDQPRRIYRLWEEGVVPAVVFELTSRSTRRGRPPQQVRPLRAARCDRVFPVRPAGRVLAAAMSGLPLGAGAIPAAGAG